MTTTINLLPPEYQKAGRTPPGLFLAVIATTFVFCGTLGALGYIYFVMLGTAQAETEIVRDELATIQPFADHAAKLEQEKKEYERRSQTIVDIGNSRILWTKKLDRLADMIHADGDVDRHMVWLKEIKLDTTQPKNKSLTLQGFSATDELTKLSDFHRDLWEDETFFARFRSISDPEGEVRESEELMPPQAFEFDFKLILEDTSTPTKKPATPAR